MKKNVRFLIVVLSQVLLLALSSCKKPTNVQSKPSNFDVAYIKLWEKNVLEEGTVIVSPDAISKTLEISVSNCQTYNATINIGDKKYEKIAESGSVIIDVSDVPTEEKLLFIKLIKSGYDDYVIQRNVIKVMPPVPDIELVSAKVLYGDDYQESMPIAFDNNGKAELTLEKIRFSSVKLEMDFNVELKERIFTEIRGNRSGDDIGEPKFAGYIVADIGQDGKETRLEPIQQGGKKYIDDLIVGMGSAGFKIKIIANKGDFKEFDLTIKNTTKDCYGNGSFRVFNAVDGNGMRYGIKQNLFFLPYYSKGPVFEYGLTTQHVAEDMAYVGKFLLLFVDFKKAPFYLYYNMFKDENKNEFKRIKAVEQSNPNSNDPEKVSVALLSEDPDDMKLDMLVAWKDKLPHIPYSAYYGVKFKKLTKPNRLFLLKLNNKVMCKDFGRDKSANAIFNLIFNYRVQTQYYNKQANGNEDENPLVIAKKQDLVHWETGTKPDGWVPFLGGGTDDTKKDTFILCPATFINRTVIKEVRHTISTKKVVGEEYDEDAIFKDAKIVPTEEGYILGTKEGETKIFEFKDGGVYKVKVTVDYTDNAKDTFLYIMDYKNTQKLNILSTGSLSNDNEIFFDISNSAMRLEGR